ncbi:hypothetical protein C2E23DRAFT_871753 [Lenzites betulinus]|nr:hypothetical protein C2E23DRAFT_871753 [Lenzites betulinus]
MPAFTATNTTLAGLGMSFDSISVASSFSSGEETIYSLFSEEVPPSSDDTDSSPAVSPVEEPTDWRHNNASAPDWQTESDGDVNYFDTYRGVPEVEHFMPWPTSPELITATTSQSAETAPRSLRATHSAPPAHIEHGYETDTESPRALRQRGRRDAHKLPRRQRMQQLEDIHPISEMGTLEDIHRLAAACASPQHATQDIAIPASPDSPAMRIDVEDLEGLFDVPLVDDEPEDEVEQDITDSFARPGFERRITESDLNAFKLWDSDDDDDDEDDVDFDIDSDDSDEDRYFYDSDGNVDEEALATNGRPRGSVHYTHSVEAPSTTQASDPVPESPPVPAHVGLGFSLGVTPYPYPITTPAASSRRPHANDGFETIDLSEKSTAATPAPAPSAPTLRPCLTAESPSPIVLASPSFRQFDDLMCLTAHVFGADEQVWAEAQSLVES